MNYPIEELVAFFCGVLLYGTAGTLGIRRLLAPHPGSPGPLRAGVGLALATHSGFLLSVSLRLGACPITNHFESIVFFSSLAVLAVLALDLFRGLPILTGLAAPLATVVLLTAVLLGPSPIAAPGGNLLWLSLHIALTLLSYAAFSVAFLAGLLFLVQERLLRAKRPGRAFHLLPPLEAMERLSTRALTVGFPLLTCGILLGGWRAVEETAAQRWLTDPKVLLSALTWLVYGAALLVRFAPAWRGRRTAYVAVLSFGLVLLTYLGTQTLSWGFHRF